MNSVIGDKRMCELSLLGEVLNDVSLEELIAYNGQFPLWKRIVVAINTIHVSHIVLCCVWLASLQEPTGIMQSFVVVCMYLLCDSYFWLYIF